MSKATQNKSFPISSEELELLLGFEAEKSLRDLATSLSRDHSVISRMLKRLSEKCPVVEKKAGKWILTELGRRVNESTRAHLSQLSTVISIRSQIRIGTNREFASRILAPDLSSIQNLFPAADISIFVYEGGTEAALLAGAIDIGIDCDRPNDPEISYKLLLPEPIICISGKDFFRNHRTQIKRGEYWPLPHLLCERLHPDKILSKNESGLNFAAKFNDIAATRAACVSNVGWALLPRYAVATEIKVGKLIQIDSSSYGNSRYGIWWPRRKKYLASSAASILAWLESKSL